MMPSFVDTVRQLRRETRVALAHRRTMRHALRRALRLTLHTQREAIVMSCRMISAHVSIRAADDPAVCLQQRVCGVIQQHPEGIGIRDVGNELGLDWRQLAEPVRALVAAGAVEQIDQEYYPVRKASGRW